MLLACSAVHHHLLRNKKRINCSIILESAEPRDIMHFVTLFGFGATAVNPYFVFELIKE